MTAFHINSIQKSIRDSIAWTAQQLANRIENRLCQKLRAAGSAFVNYVTIADSDQVGDVMYTLGQNYGKAARRPNKPFWNKGPSATRRYRHKERNSNKRNRFCSLRMQGIKGCFVCGQSHLARHPHNRAEIADAIKRHKSKHWLALLTLEDLRGLYAIIKVD